MTLSHKAIAATVCLVAIYVGLESITRGTAEPASDTPRLLRVIHKWEHRSDSIERVRAPLVDSASRASAAAIVVVNTIAIDTTIPKPHLTTGTPLDTVEMGWVTRINDTTHYAIPVIVATSYEALKAAWEHERRLRIYDSTYTIPYKDTLNVQLWQLTKSMGRDLEAERAKVRSAYVKGAAIGAVILCVFRCSR